MQIDALFLLAYNTFCKANFLQILRKLPSAYASESFGILFNFTILQYLNFLICSEHWWIYNRIFVMKWTNIFFTYCLHNEMYRSILKYVFFPTCLSFLHSNHIAIFYSYFPASIRIFYLTTKKKCYIKWLLKKKKKNSLLLYVI